jgi:glutaredoxin
MPFAWLLSWWRRSLEHVEVVLFTRRGCHLCEDAWQTLEAARRRHGFRLSVADVDSNPEWQRAYGEHVPVVTVNGRVRFRGRVNAVLLTRLLRTEGRR